MAENNQPAQQLDLNEILRTLANLPPQGPQTQQQQAQQDTQQPPWEYTPQQPSQIHHISNHAQHSQHQHAPPPHAPPPKPPQPPARPTTDARTITTWRAAIRHISKLDTSTPTLRASIRKLVKEQERNIRDWENGRKRLITEQRTKRANEVHQRAALASLPAFADTPLLRNAELDAQELHKYHEKVYRAYSQMVKSHEAELQRLGVPFFGTRPDLMRSDSENGGEEVVEGTLTRGQLRELQRKMLEHLVDLYGD